MELKKKIERLFKQFNAEEYSAFIVVVKKTPEDGDEPMVHVKKTGSSVRLSNAISAAMVQSPIINHMIHKSVNNID